MKINHYRFFFQVNFEVDSFPHSVHCLAIQILTLAAGREQHRDKNKHFGTGKGQGCSFWQQC